MSEAVKGKRWKEMMWAMESRIGSTGEDSSLKHDVDSTDYSIRVIDSSVECDLFPPF